MEPSGVAVAVARADATAPGPPPDREEVAGPFRDLTPRTPVEVIDGGFQLLRHRFGSTVVLSAALFGPIWLLDLALLATLGSPTVERSGFGPDLVLLDGGATPWGWAIVALNGLALSVLGLCTGARVRAWVDGVDPGGRELAALVLRRGWVCAVVAPAGWLVAAPFTLCGFGVGFVFGAAFVFVASTVAGAESVGPIRALSRSMSLTRANYGRCVVIVVGTLGITQLLRVSFTLGPAALVALLGGTEDLVVWSQRLSSAVVVLVEPLTACIAARAYLDLRCRSEGLDLERRRTARFGTPPADPAASAAGAP
jgi:hypothetical protein